MMMQIKYKKFIVIFLVTTLISGCVTTQGVPKIPDIKEFKPFGVNLIQMTDLLSAEIRQFKKLISDSNFNEAEKFYLENIEYFEKWSKSTDILPKEIDILANHVWSKRFENNAKSTLSKLVNIKFIPNSQQWSDVSKSLNDAMSLKNAIESNRLLKISPLGKSEVLELMQQYNRVLNLAKSEKDKFIKAQITSAIETGRHSSSYIGSLKIDDADFRTSNDFQLAVLNRIKNLVTPQEVDKDARRIEKYLNISTKSEIDKYYIQLVHKVLRSDGRITIDEMNSIRNYKPPFKSYAESLKDIVKVGYLDLTSVSFKNRNIFDFEISFKKDIDINLKSANEATFNQANIDDYDFVFVTDLTAAKVSRDFKSKEEVISRFKSGTRQSPNPNYVSATTQYQRALIEFQRAEIANAIPKSCQGKTGCFLQGLTDGLASASARKKVDEASKNLANTPQNLSLDVFSEYTYQSVSIDATKSATVNYFLIDVKDNKIYKNDFSLSDNERFMVAYNVRGEDPDKSKISRKFKNETEVTAWEKKPISVSLSSLFGSDGLKSASVEPYKGLQAFLKTLDNRSPVAGSPTYKDATSNVAGSKFVESSSKIIADERFDSVVIVRNAKATGTGFYVTPELVLTAYHVVEGSALVELTFYDGTKTYGRVVDHDIRLDLALIRAQTTGKPLKIHSGPLRLGETVEAIGHPKGYEFTITRGVISSLRKQRSATIGSSNLVEFVQTDTPISPGNSGGPLFLKDVVIGVNDWIRVDKGSQNLNFSVSFNEIRSYLDRFKGK
jgi:S1-C subfamily serine protease